MVKFSNFLKLLIVLVSFAMDTQAQLINPCVAQNAIRVVVLGSSTAAGAGVSTSDSAWVNRYEDYLLSINPNNEVINLAQGGYSNYNWSIGTVNDTALIIANNLGFGIHYISASFTDSIGCCISDSLIVGIADLVGLKELKNDFFSYPNPATHGLNFSKDVQSLQIRSLLGNTVLSQVGTFNKVGIEHLPKGLYILDITTSTDRTTLKFVKD